MNKMRKFCLVVAVLVVASSARAQTVSLAETLHAGDCFRVHIEMSLEGALKISRDGKTIPLKLEASGIHEFPERILSIGADGIPNKAARVYETAKAGISINQDHSERTLRADRQLMVAQRNKGQFLLYCPNGPLSREELDLSSDHFDTLSLPGLLPGKTAAVGDSWKVANAVAQALCNFEGLTDQNLECKLDEVKANTARISVKGSSSGIDVGSAVRLTIEAVCFFDTKSQRLTRVEWKQHDDRDQGPASPASSMDTKIVLTRSLINQPPALSDVALVPVPDGFEPAESLTHLEYRDNKAGFAFAYGREWQMVSQTEQHLVMRLLDRGDFVAQLTLTPWSNAEKGKHMTPDEFRQAMAKMPGWQQEQELQAGEVPGDKDRYIYRISAVGQLQGSKVIQNYYLAAAPDGRQIVLVFTLAPKQVDRLATKDLALAAGIEFTQSQ